MLRPGRKEGAEKLEIRKWKLENIEKKNENNSRGHPVAEGRAEARPYIIQRAGGTGHHGRSNV